jgi:energy-coupling factor transporter transmembrane protein EcfT
MIGSLRWNFIFGFVGFLMTLWISYSNNVLTTTLLRSLYSFLILFVVMFVFRWLLGTLVGLKDIGHEAPPAEVEDDHLGTALDLTTPDDEESLKQMLNGGAAPAQNMKDAEFEPMNPPRLVSNPTGLDPEQLAGALRRMTDE